MKVIRNNNNRAIYKGLAMLKFEVPQDGVFFSFLNESLNYGEDILTQEQEQKVDKDDSAFPWIRAAFGYEGALSAIMAVRSEQEKDTSLVSPDDNYLHLLHQILLKYTEFHNAEVDESGIQEIEGFALARIKYSELVELYFGDIETILTSLPKKGTFQEGDLLLKEVEADEDFLNLGETYYKEAAAYPQIDKADEAGLHVGAAIDEEETYEETDTSADEEDDEFRSFYDDGEDRNDPLSDYGSGNDEDNWGYED